MSYHVNPETGEAGLCRALRGKCPFGGKDEHHANATAARYYYEQSQRATPSPLKKKPADRDRDNAGAVTVATNGDLHVGLGSNTTIDTTDGSLGIKVGGVTIDLS